MGASYCCARNINTERRYPLCYAGYEDYQRYKSDQEINHELTTQVYREGTFVQVEWSEVIIGDIVKVEREELFPVDLILLSTST